MNLCRAGYDHARRYYDPRPDRATSAGGEVEHNAVGAFMNLVVLIVVLIIDFWGCILSQRATLGLPME